MSAPRIGAHVLGVGISCKKMLKKGMAKNSTAGTEGTEGETGAITDEATL
jgi:hypothetical protein